jgi:outer membrane lipoprotein SlyB
MFTKAACFISTIKKAGCDTPVSNFYDRMCSEIVRRNPDAYRAGFAKVAQDVAPEDAWKPVAGTTIGALLGGKYSRKLSPYLVGGGGRAKALLTLLGLIGGGVAGNRLTQQSPNTQTMQLADRSARLSGNLLKQRAIRDMVDSPLKALPRAPQPGGNSLSFSNGNPLDRYSNFMTQYQ